MAIKVVIKVAIKVIIKVALKVVVKMAIKVAIKVAVQRGYAARIKGAGGPHPLPTQGRRRTIGKGLLYGPRGKRFLVAGLRSGQAYGKITLVDATLSLWLLPQHCCDTIPSI